MAAPHERDNSNDLPSAGQAPAPFLLPVRCFARLAELTGKSEIEISVREGCTVQEFRGQLEATYPALVQERVRILIAVNGAYARDDLVLRRGDQLACFPPVSGG